MELAPDPPVGFTGGIGTPMGLHVSAPFGHLRFDAHWLEIWGDGLARTMTPLQVRRDQVSAVRLKRGFLATRVVVVDTQGIELEPYVAINGRSRVRIGLASRGWPVEG